MTWAGGRRLTIFLILGAIALAFGVVVYIATFYHTPTCTDGVQNGSEQGPDCGGSCPYLCSAAEEPPTVLFTSAIPNGGGRTDVVALVENKNPDAAAKAIPYTITLYGFGQNLIERVRGTIELPPGATVPVFVPGVASGQQAVENVFLTIDSSAIKWYALPSDPRTVPGVSNIVLGGSAAAPRITATLGNPDVVPMTGVKAIVLVRDASGNAVGASSTLVPSIPAQGSAAAIFAWNAPFPAPPVSIQVLPVIPLP